jgi:hypothetical protein
MGNLPHWELPHFPIFSPRETPPYSFPPRGPSRTPSPPHPARPRASACVHATLPLAGWPADDAVALPLAVTASSGSGSLMSVRLRQAVSGLSGCHAACGAVRRLPRSLGQARALGVH